MTEATTPDETLLARDSSEPRPGTLTASLPRNAQQKVDDLKHRVASSLAHTAESFKGQSDAGALTPVKERVSALMATAADKLENFSTPDFSEVTVETVRTQATEMIQKYPLRSLAVGLGVGLLAGRALRR